MTPYKTVAQIEAEVRSDLDLIDEPNITAQDILNYVNRGLEIAEAEIVGIHEDYLEKSAPFTLTAGQALYDAPSDLYAMKIRQIVYHNGAIMYEIKRIQGRKQPGKVLESDAFMQNGWLRYKIINASAAAGFKIRLTPVPLESGTQSEIWYLRALARVTQSTDLVDIPQFYTFIVAFVKWCCADKEHSPFVADLEKQMQNMRDEMVETLEGMVPDDDTEIEMDMSHYLEHS